VFTCRLREDAELTLLEPWHADELFEIIDHNRSYLRRWLPWVDGTRTVDDTRAFCKQALHQFAEDGTIVAGILFGGRIAGTIGLHFTTPGCREIGYWLGENYQGRGLVTDSCKALIRHAFTHLGVNRIEIRVEPGNTRSRAVPERLGFTYEGTLRQKGTNADGEPIDLMMCSLLKDEWRQEG
jgi:ribosomal-protein-serine acetyltransferase